MQSSSPDEVELVKFAKRCGYEYAGCDNRSAKNFAIINYSKLELDSAFLE
jgi:hypothetical protein